MKGQNQSLILIGAFIIGAVLTYNHTETPAPIELDLQYPETSVVLPDAKEYRCVKTEECTIRIYPTQTGNRIMLVNLKPHIPIEENEHDQL